MLALGGSYFSYQSSGVNLSFLMTTGNHALPSCKVLTVQHAAGALTNLEYGLRLDVPSNNTTHMEKEVVASKPTHSMILILDAIYPWLHIKVAIKSYFDISFSKPWVGFSIIPYLYRNPIEPLHLTTSPPAGSRGLRNKENISHKSALSNLRSFFTNPAGSSGLIPTLGSYHPAPTLLAFSNPFVHIDTSIGHYRDSPPPPPQTVCIELSHVAFFRLTGYFDPNLPSQAHFH
jgi:hypothetical protein